MKSFTDIEQSKMLAEILSIKSADMHYSKDFDGSWFVDLAKYTSVKIPKYVRNIEEHLLPCWSLAALLEILPDEIIDDNGDKIPIDIRKYDSKYLIAYRNDLNWSDTITTDEYENLVDACYEMILKLNIEKLL